MPIPPHLTQLQYGYDDGFTTIVFGLIGSCLGCILILLISFFEFKSCKKQIFFILLGYTLNKNSITSPSFTTYSLPSLLSNPLVFAFAIEPESIKF